MLSVSLKALNNHTENDVRISNSQNAQAQRGDVLAMYTDNKIPSTDYSAQVFSICLRQWVDQVISEAKRIKQIKTGGVEMENRNIFLMDNKPFFKLHNPDDQQSQELMMSAITKSERINQILTASNIQGVYFTKLNQFVYATDQVENALQLDDEIGKKIASHVQLVIDQYHGIGTYELSAVTDFSVMLTNSLEDNAAELSFFTSSEQEKQILQKITVGQQRIRQLFTGYTDSNDAIHIFVNDKEVNLLF